MSLPLASRSAKSKAARLPFSVRSPITSPNTPKRSSETDENRAAFKPDGSYSVFETEAWEKPQRSSAVSTRVTYVTCCFILRYNIYFRLAQRLRNENCQCRPLSQNPPPHLPSSAAKGGGNVCCSFWRRLRGVPGGVNLSRPFCFLWPGRIFAKPIFFRRPTCDAKVAQLQSSAAGEPNS